VPEEITTYPAAAVVNPDSAMGWEDRGIDRRTKFPLQERYSRGNLSLRDRELALQGNSRAYLIVYETIRM
jgi:hypothetical protein